MSDWAVRLGTTQRRWGRKRGASLRIARSLGGALVFPSYSHGILFVFSWCFAPGKPSGYQEHRGASIASVPELETADLSVMRIASCHARARCCAAAGLGSHSRGETTRSLCAKSDGVPAYR